MTQQELEKEVARLKIKLETLVNFLESWPSGLGSPFGRADYERDVRAALAKENICEGSKNKSFWKVYTPVLERWQLLNIQSATSADGAGILERSSDSGFLESS
jgi:hypothetical protein